MIKLIFLSSLHLTILSFISFMVSVADPDIEMIQFGGFSFIVQQHLLSAELINTNFLCIIKHCHSIYTLSIFVLSIN